MARRRIVFARINRRNKQASLELRPFREDMEALALSHRTEHSDPVKRGAVPRTWFAADMVIVPSGDFITGTLGFSEEQQHREFDRDSWSWVKGPTRQEDAGSEQTVVPFAIDLREENRWVAFATSSRMQAARCVAGLERVLRSAVEAVSLLPAEWDVDLVTSKRSIDAWINAHPNVFNLRRTVKFSNPGLDLDRDRQEMRALAANRKTEEFQAVHSQTLDTSSQAFQDKLEGVQDGNLVIEMIARGEGPGITEKFSSNKRPDETYVVEFYGDLEQGVEVVLAALREYGEVRVREDQQFGTGA